MAMCLWIYESRLYCSFIHHARGCERKTSLIALLWYISYYSLSFHTQLLFVTHWIYKTTVGVACDLSFFRKMSVNKSTRTFKKIVIQYSFYTKNRKIYVILIISNAFCWMHIQWTIPSLLYKTRRKNSLVHKIRYPIIKCIFFFDTISVVRPRVEASRCKWRHQKVKKTLSDILLEIC